MLNSRIVDAIAGKRYLFVAMCLTLAGCNPPAAHQSAASDGKLPEARIPGDRESAQKSIDDIESALSATSIDSEKYQPKRLEEAQQQVSRLKATLEQGAYQTVLKVAPLVMDLVRIFSSETVIIKQPTETGNQSSGEIAPALVYHVFAVLDHRGTHYELSNEPVSTCVHLQGEDRWPWKLAWIEGRWTGTVKSCWYMAHREKERVNMGPGSKGDVIVTVPAHDEVVVCLPYAQGKGSQQGAGPACQNIDPAYFIAVESLPHSAF